MRKARLVAILGVVVILLGTSLSYAGNQKLKSVGIAPVNIEHATYEIVWEWLDGVEIPERISFQLWTGRQDQGMPSENLLSASTLTGTVTLPATAEHYEFKLRPNMIINGKKVIPWYTVWVYYDEITEDHPHEMNEFGWLSISLKEIESRFSVDADGVPIPVPTPPPIPPEPPELYLEFAGNVSGATITQTTPSVSVEMNEGEVLNLVVSASSEVEGTTITLAANGSLLASDTVKSVILNGTREPSSGVIASGTGIITAAFEFAPPYCLLTGGVPSATWEIAFAVSDGTSARQNLISVSVNDLERDVQFAPIIAKVDRKIVSVTEVLTVPELSALEVIASASDNGGNETITLLAEDSLVMMEIGDFEMVSSVPGEATGRWTFKPGLLANQGIEDGATIIISASNGLTKSASISLTLDITNTASPPVLESIAWMKNKKGERFAPEYNIIRIDEGDTIYIELLWSGAGVLPGLGIKFPPGELITDSMQGKGTISATHTLRLTPSLAAVVERDRPLAFPLEVQAYDLDGNKSTVIIVIEIFGILAPTSTPTLTPTSTPTPRIPSTPTPTPTITPTPVKKATCLIVSQGYGGKTVNKIIRPDNPRDIGRFQRVASFQGMPAELATALGSSRIRSANTAVADIDGDGAKDVIVGFGPGGYGSVSPSIITVWNPFGSVNGPKAITSKGIFSPAARNPLLRNLHGAVNVCAGNFVAEQGLPVIIAAQGLGGDNQIRVLQLEKAGNRWKFKLIGQFQGLTGLAVRGNSSGGTSIATGDVDGDGLDELIVGQMNGEGAGTLFQVLDLHQENDQIKVASRTTPKEGMPFSHRGLGGINLAVGDIDGDGENEIITATAGNPNNSSFIWIFNVFCQPTTHKITAITPISGMNPIPVFDKNMNPSGAVDVTVGDLDEDGIDEVVVSTQAIITLKFRTGEVGFKYPPSKPILRLMEFVFKEDGTLSHSWAKISFQPFGGKYVPSSRGISVSIYLME